MSPLRVYQLLIFVTLPVIAINGFKSKMDILPLQRHLHKLTAVLDALETGMLLDHDVVLEILATEVEEVDAGFGQVTGIQVTLHCLDLSAQDGVYLGCHSWHRLTGHLDVCSAG